jgi:hypothetical protein
MRNLLNNLNNPVHNFVNNGGHFVAPVMPVLGNLFGLNHFGLNHFGLNLRGLGRSLYRERKN